MMKNYIFPIAAVLFFTTLLSPSFSKAQETIVEYEFLEHLGPTTIHPNVSADPLSVGLSMGVPAYGDGAYVIGWPQTPELNTSRYFQIAITPDSQYEMNLESINFNYRRAGNGPLFYELYWSTDG